MKLNFFSCSICYLLKALSALPFTKPMSCDNQDVQNSFGWRDIPDPGRQVILHAPASKNHVIEIDVCPTWGAASVYVKPTFFEQRLPKQSPYMGLTLSVLLNVQKMCARPEFYNIFTRQILVNNLRRKEALDPFL